MHCWLLRKRIIPIPIPIPPPFHSRAIAEGCPNAVIVNHSTARQHQHTGYSTSLYLHFDPSDPNISCPTISLQASLPTVSDLLPFALCFVSVFLFLSFYLFDLCITDCTDVLPVRPPIFLVLVAVMEMITPTLGASVLGDTSSPHIPYTGSGSPQKRDEGQVDRRRGLSSETMPMSHSVPGRSINRLLSIYTIRGIRGTHVDSRPDCAALFFWI